MPSLAEIPSGEYFVQGFINIYTEFPRADGHTVWMPNDHWEGQQWERSPDNLHSVSARLTLDPEAGYEHELVVDQVIPPITLPPDTRWVKRFKIESKILTEFWGKPIVSVYRMFHLTSVVCRLKARMSRLLSGRYTNSDNRRFAKHLSRYQDALFLFLKRPDVEATNWPAEQAIRPAVVNRKSCGGNRSQRGAETQAILMSIFRTWHQHGRSAFGALRKMLRDPAPRKHRLPTPVLINR